jgi:hypothetical protein
MLPILFFALLQAVEAAGVAVYSFDDFLKLGRENPAEPGGCNRRAAAAPRPLLRTLRPRPATCSPGP